jgi:hypothetical protein
MNRKTFRQNEAGSALVYILIAIALMGLLTMTFMEPSSQQTSAQGGFRVFTDIKSQVDVVRTAIQECVLSFPKGDANIDNGFAGTDPGARKNYPLKPNSPYFVMAEIPDTPGRLVKDIRCPGNAFGGNANNHAPIFTGATGKFMPPPPDLFEDWQYYNGTDGVFIWTKTSKSDAYLQTALQKLDDAYSECEADIVNAVGSAVDLDGGAPAEAQCDAGYTCFRVRLVTNDATAQWNGDSEGDEVSCKR